MTAIHTGISTFRRTRPISSRETVPEMRTVGDLDVAVVGPAKVRGRGG